VVQQRPGVTGKPVRLASPPLLLAGREVLLAELHTRLAGGDGPGPRTVALCGFGGAGKTSVALAYAHRHLAEVGVAWRFAAEDPMVLADGFGQLAAQLGARDVVDTRDPVASVHGVLAAFPGEWLLIFDNAPDRASVEPFLPPAGPGRVLITSRSALWPRGQALDVPVLDTEVAAVFLADRTGDADRRAALELAGELGGLPLALEQAAAYVQATGDSLAGYLASLAQRRPQMLSHGEQTGYPQTVTTPWTLAFEDLQRAAPDAAGLLRLLAFCAPEAIPLRLLLQPRPGLAGQLAPEVAPVLAPLLEDRLAAGEAIGALRRYSLISPPADGLVSVHRLVQAVTADQMPAELAEAWRQAAAALIEAAIPADPQLPESWPVCAELLPHAQAALADDSVGMGRIARYLGFSGSYVPARDLEEKIVEARERILGPEHAQTLNARSDLASLIGAAGDPAAARDQFAALLPVFKRVLGKKHLDTLSARGNLAAWTGEAGDAAASRDQYLALLPINERVLGPEHQETLAARGNLARLTGQMGYADVARDQFAALLPVYVRVLGPEHPDTLTVRSELAYWTGQAGDAAAVRDQFAALLPVYERVLGPEHPETLAVRSELARLTGQMGDAAAARDQFDALLSLRERVLGPEHPETLTAQSELARFTGRMGDAAAARDQFAALLPVYVRVLGPEHRETLTARGNLAHWTGKAGDAAAARDQYAALLSVRERVLGAEHPTTLTTGRNLAYWTKQAHRGRWRRKK
jgi:predicted component of type VI protein secretion system